MNKKLPLLLIILGLVLLGISFGPLIYDEVWYYLKVRKDQKYILENPPDNSLSEEASVFAKFISSRPIRVDPVDKEYGLVIEKIGVNVPVVKDVSVTNEEAYFEALKEGVAHAALSDYPSEEPGNVYLFAHASLNLFKLGKYATVFNLLRKLEVGDRIHIFYEGDTYIYSVVNKEKVKGWDVYPITRAVIEPVLTLQTCDPPGTTLNRLVITADLIEVQYADEQVD